MYHLLVGINIYIHSHLYLLINDTWAPLRGGAHYHLSVGTCENEYPFAHIPTNK